MNYTRVTDNVAVRPAPTGSTHAPGWYGPDTTVDYEDMNGLMGEIAAAIVALGGSLDTDVYDQLATALTEYVLTNGRFGDSLYAIKDITAPDGYRFKIFPVMVPGVTRANLRVDFVSANAILIGLDGSEVKVIDENADATFHDMTASRDIKAGTKTTISGATGSIDVNGKAAIDGATGDVTVGGEIKGAGTDPLAIGSSVEVLFEDETASVDWATSAADHEAVSPLVTYTDAPVVEITVTIANSDSSAHDIEMGSSLLLDINALNSGFTRTLIGAVAETTAGSTNPQKGLRWSCGLIKTSAGVTKLAVTSVGKTTASIAASGADTVTVKVRLQYAKLTAI